MLVIPTQKCIDLQTNYLEELHRHLIRIKFNSLLIEYIPDINGLK